MRPATRLVACSHVSWHTGRVADTAALAAAGAPVLLDGAQGLGAVPVDVGELGCDFYAASGQKWLCGPVGSGYLFVRAERIDDLTPAAPGYGTVADPLRALDFELCEGAARFDSGLPPSHHSAWALAALDTLESAGMDQVLARGPELAARLAEMLAGRRPDGAGARAGRRSSRGRPPTPRRSRCGSTTRASWCATCRARLGYAPRWARGPTRRSSSGS